MVKMPYDSIAEGQAQFPENRVIEYVEWENLAVIYKVPYLPAYTSILGKFAIQLLNGSCLGFKILLYRNPVLVVLAQVIWR